MLSSRFQPSTHIHATELPNGLFTYQNANLGTLLCTFELFVLFCTFYDLEWKALVHFLAIWKGYGNLVDIFTIWKGCGNLAEISTLF
jgi:hypothetical protein